MDLLNFNDFPLQFKHLVDGAQLQNPMENNAHKSKEAKLADDNIPDLSAAYLGPQIWNEMMLSDDLKLEPVDLDELLNENVSSELDREVMDEIQSQQILAPSPSAPQPPTNMVVYSQSPQNPESPIYPSAQPLQSNIFSYNMNQQSPNTPNLPQTPPHSPDAMGENGEEPRTSSPVHCNYQPNITDVMISTPLNGQDEPSELFDPRKRSFTDEELKPQPIIRKARKSYVSDECKDTKYWQKREKNNIAAKRSREARRIKENQIAMRANFLEKENGILRQEVQDLRKELTRLMDVVKGHEEREMTK